MAQRNRLHSLNRAIIMAAITRPHTRPGSGGSRTSWRQRSARAQRTRYPRMRHPDVLLLDVRMVSKRFGGVRAVEDVSIAVRRGAIASIIGPNGAGKTSLLNMISGFYRPDGGSITFEGIDTTRFRPAEIAALGIARTFQNIALFGGMTVLDNIMLGRHVHMKSGILSVFCLLGPGAEGGDRASRAVRGADRLSRTAGSAQAADQRARLRAAQAGRAGARAGARTEAVAARRADGRDEPGRKGGHGPLRHRRQRSSGARRSS